MRHLFFIYFFFSFTLVLGQDFHFSQFYAAPLNLNPALTGSSEQTRIGVNYRKQWPGLDFDFNGYSAFIDHYSFDLNSGLGLVLNSFNEENMNLNTTEIGLLYSYKIQVSQYGSLRLGTQLIYARKSGSLENLIFGDQIDVFNRRVNPTTIDYLEQMEPFGFLDIGFGLLYTNSDFWLGMSGYHLNSPKMTPNQAEENNFLSPKYGIQAGWSKDLPKSDYWGYDSERFFSFMLNYKTQSVFSQFDFSGQVVYDSFVYGLGFRGMMNKNNLKNYDSLIGLFGFSLNNGLVIGYSYDWMISEVGANTRGSHEFSMRYHFLAGDQKKRGQRSRVLKCFNYSF